MCRDEHAAIDWSCAVGDVYNLIRGCDPQPGAYTFFNGQKLRLFDARAVRGGTFRIGTVEDISQDGVLVGAGAGAIRAKRVRFGSQKISAGDFAAAHGLRVGARLG